MPDLSARALVDLLAWFGPLPSWAGSAVVLAGEIALLAMVGGWLRLWVLARAAPARVVALVMAVPVAVGLAWGVSEALKQLWRVDRPCRLLVSFPGWAQCPPAGDWSFPSNHAAIAGALTVGIVVIAWRLGSGWTGVVALSAGPVVVVVSRVVAGAHFPHDVVVGAVLGGIVAAMTAIVFVLITPPLIERLRHSRRLWAGGPRSSG